VAFATVTVVGTVTAARFVGDGSALTGISGGGGASTSTANSWSAPQTFAAGVSISTSSDGSLVVVAGSSVVIISANGQGVFFGGFGNLGSIAAPAAVTTNTPLAGFFGSGWDGVKYSTGPDAPGLARFIATGLWTATSHPTALDVFVTSVTSVQRQRAFIATSDRNFGIGPSNTISNKLEVQDSVAGNVTVSVAANNAGFGVFKASGTLGGCLMIEDNTGNGWTKCTTLLGVLTCSIDADGICD
jgi:hypothetical protein